MHHIRCVIALGVGDNTDALNENAISPTQPWDSSILSNRHESIEISQKDRQPWQRGCHGNGNHNEAEWQGSSSETVSSERSHEAQYNHGQRSRLDTTDRYVTYKGTDCVKTSHKKRSKSPVLRFLQRHRSVKEGSSDSDSHSSGSETKITPVKGHCAKLERSHSKESPEEKKSPIFNFQRSKSLIEHNDDASKTAKKKSKKSGILSPATGHRAQNFFQKLLTSPASSRSKDSVDRHCDAKRVLDEVKAESESNQVTTQDVEKPDPHLAPLEEFYSEYYVDTIAAREEYCQSVWHCAKLEHTVLAHSDEEDVDQHTYVLSGGTSIAKTNTTADECSPWPTNGAESLGSTTSHPRNLKTAQQYDYSLDNGSVPKQDLSPDKYEELPQGESDVFQTCDSHLWQHALYVDDCEPPEDCPVSSVSGFNPFTSITDAPLNSVIVSQPQAPDCLYTSSLVCDDVCNDTPGENETNVLLQNGHVKLSKCNSDKSDSAPRHAVDTAAVGLDYDAQVNGDPLPPTLLHSFPVDMEVHTNTPKSSGAVSLPQPPASAMLPLRGTTPLDASGLVLNMESVFHNPGPFSQQRGTSPAKAPYQTKQIDETDNDNDVEKKSSVQEWINRITPEECDDKDQFGTETVSMETIPGNHATCVAAEDDLSLGAEAKLMGVAEPTAGTGKDVVTNTMPSQLSTTKESTPTTTVPSGQTKTPQAVSALKSSTDGVTAPGAPSGGAGAADADKHRSWQQRLLRMCHTDSFNSDQSRSAYESVDQILQERIGDPSLILSNLGFGSDDVSDTDRLPMRYLQHESGAAGINVRQILENNPQLKDRLKVVQATSGIASTPLDGAISKGQVQPSSLSITPTPATKTSSVAVASHHGNNQTGASSVKRSGKHHSFINVAKNVALMTKVSSNIKHSWLLSNNPTISCSQPDCDNLRLAEPVEYTAPSGSKYWSILHPDNCKYLARLGAYGSQKPPDDEILPKQLELNSFGNVACLLLKQQRGQRREDAGDIGHLANMASSPARDSDDDAPFITPKSSPGPGDVSSSSPILQTALRTEDPKSHSRVRSDISNVGSLPHGTTPTGEASVEPIKPPTTEFSSMSASNISNGNEKPAVVTPKFPWHRKKKRTTPDKDKDILPPSGESELRLDNGQPSSRSPVGATQSAFSDYKEHSNDSSLDNVTNSRVPHEKVGNDMAIAFVEAPIVTHQDHSVSSAATFPVSESLHEQQPQSFIPHVQDYGIPDNNHFIEYDSVPKATYPMGESFDEQQLISVNPHVHDFGITEINPAIEDDMAIQRPRKKQFSLVDELELELGLQEPEKENTVGGKADIMDWRSMLKNKKSPHSSDSGQSQPRALFSPHVHESEPVYTFPNAGEMNNNIKAKQADDIHNRRPATPTSSISEDGDFLQNVGKVKVSSYAQQLLEKYSNSTPGSATASQSDVSDYDDRVSRIDPVQYRRPEKAVNMKKTSSIEGLSDRAKELMDKYLPSSDKSSVDSAGSASSSSSGRTRTSDHLARRRARSKGSSGRQPIVAQEIPQDNYNDMFSQPSYQINSQTLPPERLQYSQDISPLQFDNDGFHSLGFSDHYTQIRSPDSGPIMSDRFQSPKSSDEGEPWRSAARRPPSPLLKSSPLDASLENLSLTEILALRQTHANMTKEKGITDILRDILQDKGTVPSHNTMHHQDGASNIDTHVPTDNQEGLESRLESWRKSHTGFATRALFKPLTENEVQTSPTDSGGIVDTLDKGYEIDRLGSTNLVDIRGSEVHVNTTNKLAEISETCRVVPPDVKSEADVYTYAELSETRTSKENIAVLQESPSMIPDGISVGAGDTSQELRLNKFKDNWVKESEKLAESLADSHVSESEHVDTPHPQAFNQNPLAKLMNSDVRGKPSLPLVSEDAEESSPVEVVSQHEGKEDAIQPIQAPGLEPPSDTNDAGEPTALQHGPKTDRPPLIDIGNEVQQPFELEEIESPEDSPIRESELVHTPYPQASNQNPLAKLMNNNIKGKTSLPLVSEEGEESSPVEVVSQHQDKVDAIQPLDLEPARATSDAHEPTVLKHGPQTGRPPLKDMDKDVQQSFELEEIQSADSFLDDTIPPHQKQHKTGGLVRASSTQSDSSGFVETDVVESSPKDQISDGVSSNSPEEKLKITSIKSEPSEQVLNISDHETNLISTNQDHNPAEDSKDTKLVHETPPLTDNQDDSTSSDDTLSLANNIINDVDSIESQNIEQDSKSRTYFFENQTDKDESSLFDSFDKISLLDFIHSTPREQDSDDDHLSVTSPVQKQQMFFTVDNQGGLTPASSKTSSPVSFLERSSSSSSMDDSSYGFPNNETLFVRPSKPHRKSMEPPFHEQSMCSRTASPPPRSPEKVLANFVPTSEGEAIRPSGSETRYSCQVVLTINEGQIEKQVKQDAKVVDAPEQGRVSPTKSGGVPDIKQPLKKDMSVHVKPKCNEPARKPQPMKVEHKRNKDEQALAIDLKVGDIRIKIPDGVGAGNQDWADTKPYTGNTSNAPTVNLHVANKEQKQTITQRPGWQQVENQMFGSDMHLSFGQDAGSSTSTNAFLQHCDSLGLPRQRPYPGYPSGNDRRRVLGLMLNNPNMLALFEDFMLMVMSQGSVPEFTRNYPSHWPSHHAVTNQQQLLDEVKLVQNALLKYKAEFRALEKRLEHQNSITDKDATDSSAKQSAAAKSLQDLYTEVGKEIVEMERLLAVRVRSIIGGEEISVSDGPRVDMASLNVIQKMIELLKEQVYHGSVVGNMSGHNQGPDHLTIGELQHAAEDHDQNMRSSDGPHVAQQMALLQHQISAQMSQTTSLFSSHVKNLKDSLVSEIRNSIQEETQQLRMQVESTESQLFEIRSRMNSDASSRTTTIEFDEDWSADC